MFLWCIFRFKKPEKTYNHCEVVIDDSKELRTSGAIAEGVKTRSWTELCNSYNNNFKFQAYKLGGRGYANTAIGYLTEAENTPYEYSNFFYHTVKIFTGKWIGSKDKKRLYCYEHGLRFLEKYYGIKLDDFMNPYEAKKFLDNTSLPIYKLSENMIF